MITALAGARPVSEPSISLSIVEPQYRFGSVQLNDGLFATLQASTSQDYTTNVGAPKLPIFNYLVEIPVGAKPSLTLSGESWIETTLASEGVPGQIEPVQQSVVKQLGASAAFTQDASVYQTNAFSPFSVASIRTVGWIRGHRVALIEVSPVKYNPVTGALRLLTSCTISVSLPGSDMSRTKSIFSQYDSPSFISQDQFLFENYGVLEAGITPLRTEGYVMIVHDEFADAIQPFAEWKSIQGFDVTITLTSQIPGGVTTEHIRDYIKDAYENWSVPPTYVLLVGDTPQIPSFTGSISGSCTDLNFVTVNGSDYFADLFIGRFSCSTEDQVTAIVEKSIYYEQGNFPDTSWIKKGAYMASDDPDFWQVAEGTQNYVIATYLEPAGFGCDKLYAHTFHSDTDDIMAALNEGRSLACYSGHGGPEAWGGPYFDPNNINALTNDGMYLFVASHACLTGKFSVPECFGETWIRVPHKGGFAFWGASDGSLWDEDDILERAMYSAWFDDRIDFICGMTNMALYDLYQHYGGGGNTQYYFQIYNLLGDPSAKLWCEEPTPNLPPGVPDVPTGPTQGVTFLTYTFTAIASTDPEGQKIFLKFNFGDGNTSEYLGPYTPGQSASVSYSWQQAGMYEIRAKAMDENGSQSSWSDPHLISIVEMPKLNITAVKGGIGFRITVENMADQTLQTIPWSVEPRSTLILVSRGMDGTIGSLAAGDETTIRTGMLAGFGPLTFTIIVGDAHLTGTGFLLGIFVVVLK